MPKQMKLKLYRSDEGLNSDCKPTIRRLKVYYSSRHGSSGYTCQPLIRISGKYLRDYGFKTGDIVELTLSAGQIVIKKVKPA